MMEKHIKNECLMCITESLCCTTEIAITLEINYTSIKNKNKESHDKLKNYRYYLNEKLESDFLFYKRILGFTKEKVIAFFKWLHPFLHLKNDIILY